MSIEVVKPSTLPVKVNVDGTEYFIIYNDTTKELERTITDNTLPIAVKVSSDAIGDGVSDDTSFVQSALDASNGLFVFLREGKKYKTTITDAELNNYYYLGNGSVVSLEGNEIRPNYAKVVASNWVSDSGGRNIIFNPESVNLPVNLKNSNVVLGGRSSSYEYTLGVNAELSFCGGGGDTLQNHLAGTICGGAHHIMSVNNDDFGSHGFIGGGSFNENYGDYAVIVGGTQLKAYSTRSVIGGGFSSYIGDITDRLIGENSFMGAVYQSNITGSFAGMPVGRSCTASEDYTLVSGYYGTATLYGAEVRASGRFSALGDAQRMNILIRRTTTNAIATQLLLDGASKTLSIGSNTLWTIEGTVGAVRTDVTGDVASYKVDIVVYNDGTTTILKSSNVTVLHEDNAAWNLDVIVSGSQLQIRGTGVAGQTIRWMGDLKINQIRNI